jgi:hypothetical protein
LGLVVPAARQALWWVVRAAPQVLAPINMAAVVAAVVAVHRQRHQVAAGRQGLSIYRATQVAAQRQDRGFSSAQTVVVLRWE